MVGSVVIVGGYAGLRYCGAAAATHKSKNVRSGVACHGGVFDGSYIKITAKNGMETC